MSLAWDWAPKYIDWDSQRTEGGNGIEIYSDGSSFPTSGQAGYAVVVANRGGQPYVLESGRLSDWSPPLTTELVALDRALDLAPMVATGGEAVTILVDCKQALSLVACPSYRSKLVLSCKDKINRGNVKLKFIKAHASSQGNNMADAAAKGAACSGMQPRAVPVAWSRLRHVV